MDEDQVLQEFTWKIKNGELGDVKSYVEKKGCDVSKEIQGRFPLHYAADYGQPEIIEYLVSKGAEVNLADKYGITPLLSAIFEGHTSCVQVLLKKGANKALKSPDGATYLECAESDEIRELLK